jgi:hypothetical protein
VHEKVAAVARKAGLHVLDLIPAFAEQGGDWKRWWATPYNSHPNPAAYHVAADAIAKYIRDHHLLPDQPDVRQCSGGGERGAQRH